MVLSRFDTHRNALYLCVNIAFVVSQLPELIAWLLFHLLNVCRELFFALDNIIS